ncbi:alpha/beta fold hydrolase [Streptomyces sp. TRM 70361]|uniref:esterase/lipase family protein n=1 Tax=Streptomyces sp. TRM 70361 TaxID=3116553 RepID=UPI002E7B75CF|nr:alpha/beta fold hydrolase [Streptomyces sp. TRM 70361]MEE1940641.1 alpha/beta fold hydrolase [Streptomyces sp. TRM 70361]
MKALPLVSGALSGIFSGALPLSLVPLAPRGLRAAALEAAFLAGRTLLYPVGMAQERYVPARVTEEDGCRGTAGRIPRSRAGRDHPPVLLLHGFIDNRSVFTLLRRSLARNGWRDICALNYSPLTRDIRHAAERLAECVEEICEGTGRSRIDVVGHSMGGLIARYYIQRMGGDARIRTLVTLGTPHSGTRVAPLASAHPIVRQLRPDSEVIEELARPAPGCRTRFVAFWSDLDQLMDPVETARIDHPDLDVCNVRVRGLGHLALPAHWEVAADIREKLTTGARPGRPAEGSAGAA